jgi:xylan 1,4-beta-xylosidase
MEDQMKVTLMPVAAVVAAGALAAAAYSHGFEVPEIRPAAPAAPLLAEQPPLPKDLQPLFDYPVRDTFVLRVGDTYYLTGTTGHPEWWRTNEGVRLWKSRDLKEWEPMGLVWSIERDGTWQKPIDAGGRRAIWAPEIHYIRDNFYITYCMNWVMPGEGDGGTGILRSTTGKPEGPYVDVNPKGPITRQIDGSLFVDDDGTVYFVWMNGKIARLKDDLSGLAELPRLLQPANDYHVGFEGAFLFKANGRYHLACADFLGPDNEYHAMVASSDNLMGPYGDRYIAVPHGGHNNYFQDRDGNWWSTFFGNDKNAPFLERPAILRVEFGKDGRIRPLVEPEKEKDQ